MAHRNLKWAIAMAALACPIALVSIVNAVPREPDYFCYDVALPQGVRNLNEMCAQNPPLQPKEESKPSSPDKAEATKTKSSSKKPAITAKDARTLLEFSDLSYEDDQLSGAARNKARKLLRGVAINYEVQVSRDKVNWKPLSSSSTCLNVEDLAPGKTARFRASVASGDKLIITSVQPESSICSSPSSSSSSSGVCDYPNQLDSAGRRCGNRAKYK